MFFASNGGRIRIMAFGSIKRSLSNYIIVGDWSGFQKLDAISSKKILYFTATWCGPCRRIAPVFESLSKEFKNISFAKIDVDQVPEAASNIRAVPTFILKNGEEIVDEFSGGDEARLRSSLIDLDTK